MVRRDETRTWSLTYRCGSESMVSQPDHSLTNSWITEKAIFVQRCWPTNWLARKCRSCYIQVANRLLRVSDRKKWGVWQVTFVSGELIGKVDSYTTMVRAERGWGRRWNKQKDEPMTYTQNLTNEQQTFRLIWDQMVCSSLGGKNENWVGLEMIECNC